MNDLGKLNPDISDKGYRANISYIDQNADGTLGWAIGYARMQSPTAEERFNAWGYPELTDGTNTAFLIGGAKPYVKSNELKRDGVLAVVEWEPSDKFQTTRSEEHTTELTSLMRNSDAVFCLKKQTTITIYTQQIKQQKQKTK